jgi:hypothetical protein
MASASAPSSTNKPASSRSGADKLFMADFSRQIFHDRPFVTRSS